MRAVRKESVEDEFFVITRRPLRVRLESRRVTFDDHAPLAALRRSITGHRAGR
jgi:hypothetical protein